MMPIKRISHQKNLITSIPPRKSKVSSARPKPSERVLTSAESIKIMEEKEKKQDKIDENEKRRHLREENKKSKESKLKPKGIQKLEGIAMVDMCRYNYAGAHSAQGQVQNSTSVCVTTISSAL